MSPRSVKDYDPRFLQVWRAASRREEVKLPVKSRQLAIGFRHDLHRLRKAMKAEAHQLSDAVQSVKIKIEFETGSGTWIAYNTNAAMKKGGYDIDQPSWRLRMIPYNNYDLIEDLLA
jgi:hypothetical protein